MKIKLLIVLFLTLFSFKDSPKKNRYSISDIDYKYTFYLTDKKVTKLKQNKKYHWYRSQKIHETVGDYDGDLLNGVFVKSFRSNQLAEKGVFKNGLKIGVWKKWFENGNLRTVAYWNNGLRRGRFIEYNDQGSLKIKGDYSNGKKNDMWIDLSISDTLYYKNGILLAEKPRSITTKTKILFEKIFKKDSLKSKNKKKSKLKRRPKHK